MKIVIPDDYQNLVDRLDCYDLLRRIAYFEPSSKVSRGKLQNLIDAQRALGNADAALTVDRLVMPGVTELTD